MKRAHFLAVCIAVSATAMLPALPAAAADEAKPAGQDQRFVNEAAAGGQAEVEFGKLAASMGTADAVRSFGQKMVQDHTKADDQLKALAGRKGLSVPTGMDQPHEALLRNLKTMTGAEFDRAYIHSQTQDHRKMLALFAGEQEKGADPDLKALAADTLPMLRDHLQTAQQIEDKIGGRPLTGSTSNRVRSTPTTR